MAKLNMMAIGGSALAGAVITTARHMDNTKKDAAGTIIPNSTPFKRLADWAAILGVVGGAFLHMQNKQLLPDNMAEAIMLASIPQIEQAIWDSIRKPTVPATLVPYAAGARGYAAQVRPSNWVPTNPGLGGYRQG